MRISILVMALGALLCINGTNGRIFQKLKDKFGNKAQTGSAVDNVETSNEITEGGLETKPEVTETTTPPCRKNKKGKCIKVKAARSGDRKGNNMPPLNCKKGKCNCMNYELKYKLFGIAGHVVLNCQNMHMRKTIMSIQGSKSQTERGVEGGEKHGDGSIIESFTSACMYLRKKGEEMKENGYKMPFMSCHDYEDLIESYTCLNTYMDLFEVNVTRKIFRGKGNKDMTGEMVLKLECMMKDRCDKLYGSAECLINALTEETDAAKVCSKKKTSPGGQGKPKTGDNTDASIPEDKSGGSAKDNNYVDTGIEEDAENNVQDENDGENEVDVEDDNEEDGEESEEKTFWRRVVDFFQG